MSGRITEDEQSWYICGQCNTKIFYLKTEPPVVPCPECGWQHKARKKYKLPRHIKLDLNNY